MKIYIQILHYDEQMIKHCMNYQYYYIHIHIYILYLKYLKQKNQQQYTNKRNYLKKKMIKKINKQTNKIIYFNRWPLTKQLNVFLFSKISQIIRQIPKKIFNFVRL